ncbi:hypothetical protein ACFVWN_28295 [Nocardiopsis flavescens]|uniref:hypothetical protein n=1 Tax=Nocardiopsis flavescens TaxID=758803 RepID=UPI0036523BA0
MSAERGDTGPDPDVEIAAGITADELVFREVPEVAPRTRAEPDGEGASDSERSGLPYGVEAGTVYRDVRVDYRLVSRADAAPDVERDPPGDG